MFFKIMSIIRYKQSSNFLFIIYSIILFVVIAITGYKIWVLGSITKSFILPQSLFVYLYAVIVYEKIIPIFNEDNVNIWLDCGLIKKRIKIEKTQISNVEELNLNNQFIRLTISLANGDSIDYMPPSHATFALEEVYINIKNITKKSS